jgi:CubicO group peptidase (beta-lactamase class C family)
MSKTFAALLIRCALEDGLLASVDQRLVTYLPELASKRGYEEVTLEHLLGMTSGIDFDEESLDDPALYYSTDLRGRMYSYDVNWAPGKRYLYGSINIQLLWGVLHRRLGGGTVSQYFEKRIWEPIGARGGQLACRGDENRHAFLTPAALRLRAPSVAPRAQVDRYFGLMW